MKNSDKELPKEVVALVHHVELNTKGWWEKAIQRLIMGVIWLSNGTLNIDGIRTRLLEDFNLNLTPSKLTSALAKMDSGDVIRMHDGTYAIPDQRRNTLDDEIRNTEQAEAKARSVFYSILTDVDITEDRKKLWESFVSDFLTPLIKEIGANTYSLIKRGSPIPSENAIVDEYLGKYDKGLHSDLRKLVSTFLDPKHEDTKNYIMRLLHARFCVEASGLSEQDLEKLSKALGEKMHFRLFVDTNFLLSLMDIHENPYNEAAQELKELVDQLNTNPLVKFYMLPGTVKEAKAVIQATKSQLSSIRTSSNIARAATKTGVSGIYGRYLKELSKDRANINLDNWFDPYIKNFVAMASDKGVSLFNTKLDEYTENEEVLDDISSFMKNEETRYSENRRRPLNSVEHDMVLLHFVKEKRPAYIEAPMEANDWVITVDKRLIDFERKKQSSELSTVPLCIHPEGMIQLLQFWVPRSKEFEEAILGSMRLPFLFQDFDPEAEKTTIKILAGLGRFDSIEEMSEDTITKILVNDNLRSKMSVNADIVDDDIQLIHDTLINELQIAVASAT